MFGVMLSCLFIVALWSSAGKGLASWLLSVCCFLLILLLSPCGVLGQVCYLIALIPDLSLLQNVYDNLFLAI